MQSTTQLRPAKKINDCRCCNFSLYDLIFSLECTVSIHIGLNYVGALTCNGLTRLDSTKCYQMPFDTFYWNRQIIELVWLQTRPAMTFIGISIRPISGLVLGTSKLILSATCFSPAANCISAEDTLEYRNMQQLQAVDLARLPQGKGAHKRK